MKLINLDKLTTRRDVVLVLGGVEHVMRVPTVKDYIEQMKKAEQIQSMVDDEPTIENASKLLQLTIEALMRSFPTITRDQFEALSMDQLNAIRTMAEDATESDVSEASDEGEATGKVE